MTASTDDSDRYTVISADGHAGAQLQQYRAYLASSWQDRKSVV